MLKHKSLTIADVARRARVSITTASRVINRTNHPVNAGTRRRVLKAVQELGFAPSAIARALATRRTGMVGVIVGDTNDPYFSAIVRGIENAAREHGYIVVVCNSDRNPEVELEYVRTLLNHQVDGLIFAGGGLTQRGYLREIRKLTGELRRRGGEVITLSEHLFPAPQVTIDNKAAACDLTEYLIRLGHREIACIAGPAGLNTTRLRAGGYRHALEAAGIPFDPGRVVRGDFKFEGGMHAVERLLAAGPGPTAILACNDEMAIGAMVALKERGLRIPGDISLVGFDDILAARYVDPPLTTVKVPLMEMGATGMRQLLQMLEGKEVEPVHWLRHEIVERRSAGPPGSLHLMPPSVRANIEESRRGRRNKF